jgi:uncharacterized cupredoxin-like copper-binding protein
MATLAALAAMTPPSFAATTAPKVVQVELYEWKIELEPASVPPGPVRFAIVNKGQIPHGFEVEGHGVEKKVAQIPAGKTATLLATLPAGSFETYCPIGNGSHKMLGMHADLKVSKSKPAGPTHAADDDDHEMAMSANPDADYTSPRTMRVSGGGAVIHILPGPFPFADSAAAVIAQRPADQQADLTKKAHNGPYSNNVAPASGTISITATDRGATADQVDGTAEFTTEDKTRWKLVMDRVQTRDIPYNPRFGGVIMGLYYHGASGVHTPLVPTIQSSLALWAFGHLYRNDALVTDSAMVHVMLLSRTRREGDWALQCWDCSHNPIEELQLQVTPPPGGAPFDAPGGVLFLNWEKSSGETVPAKS